MKETAGVFGPSKLAGVVTHAPTPSDTGVIILNAGILHHIGPHRLFVTLSRRLAEQGFPALRFDFSGLGDSDPRSDGLPFQESTLVEVRDAMDHLASVTGVRRFVLAGLCSGADNGLRVATQEARVAGVAAIEAYAFESPGRQILRHLGRATAPSAWAKLLLGRAGLVDKVRDIRRAAAREAARLPAEMNQVWAMPSREDLRANLGQLAQRGTQLLFVFARGGESYANYLWKLRPILRGRMPRERVEIRVLAATDHTFTPLARQEDVLAAVTGWVRTRFSTVPARREAGGD